MLVSTRFGYDRYVNQQFYHRKEWRRIRDIVITRDMGCELGLADIEIAGLIVIHHINPITVNDIVDFNPDILNPEYLICTSEMMHKAIHYSDERLIPKGPIERRPFDQAPWRIR